MEINIETEGRVGEESHFEEQEEQAHDGPGGGREGPLAVLDNRPEAEGGCENAEDRDK